MKVQSALENTIQKKSSTKSVKFSGNEVFERIFCPVIEIYHRFWDSNVDGPRMDRARPEETGRYEGFENLVEDEGMKIITDLDDDVFIDENKSLIK